MSTPNSQMLMDRASKALELAIAAGADDARVWASRTREVEYTGRDGTLETVKEATARSLDLTLWVGGRYSSHSTTSLQPDRLRAFVDEAVALTRALQPDPHRALPDPSLYADRTATDLELLDGGIDALESSTREEWLTKLNESLRADERVISATGYVGGTLSESAVLSSNGLEGTNGGTQLWVGGEVTVKDEGDKRPEGSWWVGVRQMEDLPSLEEVANKALEQATIRIGSTKGPTSKTQMVLDPRTASRLIQRLLGAMNARGVYQGRSFYAGKVGEKLFSDKLTITDEPHRPRGLGSRPYDGEGIASQPRTMINGGVVEQLYVDTYYGSKAEMPVNGGGRSNVVVASGSDKDFAGLLYDIGEGIYVSSWLGGNADGTTGDFSFGVRGHHLHKGQVGKPIGEMNVTGNFVDLFSRLAAVGNDPWPYRSTMVPSMVFEGVDFSGA
jgi:PmbA protein